MRIIINCNLHLLSFISLIKEGLESGFMTLKSQTSEHVRSEGCLGSLFKIQIIITTFCRDVVVLGLKSILVL
jgi:hypothetical protein